MRPLPIIKDARGKAVQRYEYTCSQCGSIATNRFTDPIGSRMLEHKLCFSCDFWKQKEKYLNEHHKKMTIIGGCIYRPGTKTTGKHRGMGGRRFDIEYVEPSIHAGKIITTFDLWAGSIMPEYLREQFEDTARFVGGASRAKVGEITCWDPSDGRNERYPLPRSLDLK